MSSTTTSVVCAGCGASGSSLEPFPFRCPNAGSNDTDHVMTRTLDPGAVRWPEDREPNPFVRYRRLFHSYDLARAAGMSDEESVTLVRRLDDAVARVDGHGFEVTPFGRSDALSERLGFGPSGGVWVKDETENVSGSHKARHLMGLMILLEVADRLPQAHDGSPARDRDLAIASCGNAALAAAVLARAGERRLEVFVPTWADPTIVGRLTGLGARVTVCSRSDGVPGDPAYKRLQDSILRGALPFTCQGPDSGLTIEGGETLAWEMASQLGDEGVSLHRVFIQVGGGALASACIQGLREAVALGALDQLPSFHTVQTLGGHPLKRAFDRVVERIRAGSEPQEVLRYASTHRSEFMWPWEEEPKSIANGILDDETYDWLAVVRGMVETGGTASIVSEETLEEANRLAREATGIDVDHTGSAGLAGLLDLKGADLVGPDERVAVLFTGVRRRNNLSDFREGIAHSVG